ncbi:MAG TPA: FAD:protein FMN transferase [Solirubrobacteraceae bacterium]|nr:FAD:protein FMN transferase [Solirubrobacteraceae bacterium]
MTATASFPALGSTAVVVTAADVLPEARAAVERAVAAIDRACSRFREDSELTALNRRAGRPTRVSPLLLHALQVAVRAAVLTDGDVDPTLGAALVALGYDRDFSMGLDRPGAGGPGGPPRLRAVPGWRAIEIDAATSAVGIGRGVRLDLGATAKALAADRAAGAASAATGAGVLVALGGDIATAGPAPDGGWRVRVTDDHRAGLDAPGQWITIREGGLATSSTTVRRWRHGDEELHHLLDPRSARPAAGPWRTVSAAAATCVDANIATTAALVRGERAAGWLTELQLPSRLVSTDGRALHLGGWPSEGEELASMPAPAGALT